MQRNFRVGSSRMGVYSGIFRVHLVGMKWRKYVLRNLLQRFKPGLPAFPIRSKPRMRFVLAASHFRWSGNENAAFRLVPQRENNFLPRPLDG